MTASPQTTTVYRFPNWELRPLERALLVNGVRAKIGSRAFDVLLALAERQGRVVSKKELIDTAWPDLIVEENNLSVQISTLRKLLGLGAIANIAGQGYQLVAAEASEATTADSPSLGAQQRLFGREIDLDALRSLVSTQSLVTIVGTGGVGKTSLAKSILAESRGRWSDGIHWIDLTPLRDSGQVAHAIAQSLGIYAEDPAHDSEELIGALSQLRALIALDNCEHLLGEVIALLGLLLPRAPNIRWLATSREPLHLVGESVYRLGSLDVPLPGTELGAALRHGALALLSERARAVDSKFELGASNVGTAVELCRQLDGLPLAIEMAAARVATLGLQGVHDQIDQRLRLRAINRDAPGRHHTLLQTYEWSYGLLSPEEQRVFRRLEPFAGGFTAQMAQQLCCSIEDGAERLSEWQMLDALSALVDKSLVQHEHGGTASSAERFYLLESARDYARLRLEETLEVDAVHRRHAEVVADWFTSALHEHRSWRDKDWVERYSPERRNVCAALEWICSVQEPDLLARLIAALALLDNFAHADATIVRYHLPMDVLERASLRLRGRANLELGWAHFLDGNRELGTTFSLRALADLEALADAEGVYTAFTRLIRLYQGRPGMESKARDMWARLKQIDESQVSLRARLSCHSTVALLFDGGRSIERLEELQRIAQHAGFDAQAAVCRLNKTNQLLLRGSFEEVVEMTDRMLEAGEPLVRVRGTMYYNRAHALVRLGRIEEARVAAQAVLRAWPGYAHLVLDLFAVVALQNGRSEDAALMAGCSARIKHERDLHDASEAKMITETLERMERELGTQRTRELMRQGSEMSTVDMFALALTGPTSH